MSIRDEDKHKLRAFVKTYLYMHGDATARELAEAANTIDLGLRKGITSSEMTGFLTNCMSVRHSSFLNSLKFRKERNVRVYHLEK